MRTRTWALLLGLLLAASLLPRIPLLANAEAAFTSDEAVDALAVQHLLAGTEISAFNWDTTYYGIVEGLMAIPFVAVLGPSALAFKLSAVVGFLALLVAVFSLGRALYGEAEGLAGAALLAVFSPQLVFWSTLAAGGYCLVVAWGTLTLLCFLHALRAPARRLRFAALGFFAGFGLYIYELYLPYFALLLLAGGIAFLLSLRSLPALRERLGTAALAVAGFALGAAPKLIAALLGSGRGAKRPTYALAGGEQVLSNVRLLVRDCIPALFGVNPGPETPLELYNGPALGRLASVLGALLLLAYAAAWAWALVRVARPPANEAEESARRWTEALLVALIPLVALLFVLSPNPQDGGSNRYLLPWLSALPLAGAALVRWGRRHLPAAVAAGLLAIGLPALHSALWLVDHEYLTPSLEVAERREPLRGLLPALRSQGLAGGYAGYWNAYKATFLAGEKLVFAPYMGWDRYPPYSRRLRDTDRVAWIFPGEVLGPDPLEASLLNQLASSGRPYRMLRVSGYRVYVGADGRRLLPPPLLRQPVPLARPRAELLSAAVPARAVAGSQISVPVKLVNRSDAFWAAAGLPFQAGAVRVSASYRWLAPDGVILPIEGERSLLPEDVPVGGTLEMIVRVQVPALAGPHLLRLTLVQEGVAWFDQDGASLSDHPVEILAAQGPQANSLER